MQITNVTVKLSNQKNSKVVAFASVVIDNAIAIHSIRLLKSAKGMWIQMPNRKAKGSSEYFDTVHPINTEARNQIQEAIVSKYEEVKAQLAEKE